ncbi:beta-ketoacyl synthase N-terminal-like domain-containing protein [Paenibacillus sp. CN-4]|uniref:type I polyketide synthase n=1 Tax=Paenibacillus nanchangensis TaxID=3348343 RepID=UPI00397CB1D4
MDNEEVSSRETGLEIAVIGMSGRFPGADDLEQYWELLMKGASAVSYFQEEELISHGVPEHTVRHPRYVKAKPYIKNVYDFDAALFGYAPWEAENMDPQIRLFHECVYHALEHSGYHSDQYDGKIGMYAGAPLDIEWTGRHLSQSGSSQEVLETGIVSSKDFLSQLISYKLNLSGPSYTLYTACSTSLAAIHLACQGLLLGDCNLAVAGGVTLEQPSLSGYLYEEGKIHSQSGVCRPFDSRADGTIFGEGAGAVVLKRLADAVQDGDYIHAVIKGSSSNNDGRRKVGFAAPSLEGQKEVLRSAWEFADIDPSTIGYIEAHGTGTKVGDPIEFEALRQLAGQREARLPIGSVKGNIGHLHAAAGIAGFIKTVFALERETIPPTAGFEEPNPLLEMAHSPFYVNRQPLPWKRKGAPRRAGISSFGVGGTNVHLVLEEAPPRRLSSPAKGMVILPFSAKSAASLQNSLRDMAAYFQRQDDVNLADAAYTLQVGRGQFNYRAVCMAESTEEAAQRLSRLAENAVMMPSNQIQGGQQPVFMFTGQGSQYPGMGAEMYHEYSVFRQELDKLAEMLAPKLGTDIRKFLIHQDDSSAQSGPGLSELNQTWLAQPALFALEYALAKLWISLGIKPALMAGHSIGEYVAATLAGVFRLEDALDIVVARGRLMQSAPDGIMVAAAVPPSEASLYTSGKISLAAVNTPSLCVFSGGEAELAQREAEWEGRGVFYRRLNTSHAFHSAMMDDILEPFRAVVRGKTLSVPQTPFYSCLTGELITGEMAMDPDYWVNQLRGTVRFSAIAAHCLADERNIFIEVGPGKTLCSLIEAQADGKRLVLSTLGSRSETERHSFLESLSSLWLQGAAVTWEALHTEVSRQRIPLPVYCFDRQTYMPPSPSPSQASATGKAESKDHGRALLYQPVWKPIPLPELKPKKDLRPAVWLILQISGNLGPYAVRMRQNGDRCITVQPGAAFSRNGPESYTLNPASKDHFLKLAEELTREGIGIDCLLHGWCLEEKGEADSLSPPQQTSGSTDDHVHGYVSLLHLLSALGDQVLSEGLQLYVAASGIADVYGSADTQPIRAAMMGPLLAIPHEFPGYRCKIIDVHGLSGKQLAARLEQEITSQDEDGLVAYRGTARLVRQFEPIPYAADQAGKDSGEAIAAMQEAAAAAEMEDRQVILYLSSSEDPNLLQFLASRKEVSVLRSAGENLREIEQAVANAAELTGRIDGIIFEPALDWTDIRTLKEREDAEDAISQWNNNITVFKHLNACLAACGAELGFGWILSSLASVVGGYGLCGLAAGASVNDALSVSKFGSAITWAPVNRDFIRKGAYPVTGITEEEAVSTYKQLWALRDQLSRAVISAAPLRDRAKNKERQRLEADRNSPVSPRPLASPVGFLERSPRLGPCLHPVTEAEKVLCELASEQLGVHPVGIEDHFYDLGGHSLLLIRLLSRIKDVFRVELPLSTMLESPTVSGVLGGLEREWGSREVLEEIAVSFREYQKLMLEELK